MYWETCRLNFIVYLFLLVVCMGPYPISAASTTDAQNHADSTSQKPTLPTTKATTQLLIKQNKQINLLHTQIEEIRNTMAKGLKTNAELEAESHQTRERNRMISVIVVCIIAALSLFASLHYTTKICMHSDNQKMRRNDTMSIIALHLIVFGTLLLVLSAIDTEQLTAAVGILGALAGYVFRGLSDQRNTEPDQDTKPDTAD